MGEIKLWIEHTGYFAKVCVPHDADIYDLKEAAKLKLTVELRYFCVTMIQFYLPDANAPDPLYETALVLPFYNEDGVGKTYERAFILICLIQI
jgi:hypothetical protein